MHQHVYPATGEVQGPVPLAGVDDVDDAVRAAQRGLRDLADLDARGSAGTCSSAWPTCSTAAKDELARLSVLDNGMTYGIAHFTATSVGRLRPLLRRLGRQDRGPGHLVAGPRP